MKQTSLFVLYLCYLLAVAIAQPCNVQLNIAAVSANADSVGYPATNAVDRNYSIESRWSAKGPGVYITADLGSVVPVCSLNVAWWQSDVRTSNFEVATSSDNNVYTTKISNGVSTIGPQTLQSYGFATTAARFVRLTVNGNSQSSLWASVIELTVSGLAPTPTPTVPPTPAPAFVHPGVLVNKAQLDFVKGKIQSGAQPWITVFNKAKAYSWAQPSYTAQPVSWMTFPNAAYRANNPNEPYTDQCSRAKTDGLSAYTQALLWVYTDDARYATSAYKILNAWQYTLQTISFGTTNDGSEGGSPLQAAWMGQMYVRAAEILRRGGNSGWPAADAVNFEKWLYKVIYKHTYKGWFGGNNWDKSMIDASINIAVYSENKTAFDSAVALWRRNVPGYIYVSSDGAQPVCTANSCTAASLKSTWNNANTYINGMMQETCRDLGHTQMGLAAIIDTAETARIQGVDLYSAQQSRIVTGMEFLAKYINLGSTTVDNSLCDGTLDLISLWSTWEIAYNHYANRKGLTLPESAKIITKLRASGPYSNDLFGTWEELTHGDVGKYGL